MVLDRVVQQPGDDHVHVPHLVVVHQPDRHPQQVVEVRLAYPAVVAVQVGSQVERLGQPVAGGLVERLDLQPEPGQQAGSPWISVIACIGMVARYAGNSMRPL